MNDVEASPTAPGELLEAFASDQSTMNVVIMQRNPSRVAHMKENADAGGAVDPDFGFVAVALF